MNKAKEILLSDESLTCVLCDGKNVLKSSYSGIRPMLEFISKGTDFSEYSAADRIVGRAAAMLFVLAGVKEVYACVFSKGGEDVLKKHGISYQFGESADTIINRSGNDICPMEKAVMGMDNPDSAYKAILRTVEELRK